MVRLEGYEERKPSAALGRPAPARRARPRARQPAPRAAARRAARRARPQAPRGDADRAQGHPAAGRHHLHLRDPRPGGGAHDERPARGVQPRPDRAGRGPGRRLRAPGDAFVAGFVGTSNLLTGDVARAVLGTDRHLHDPAREDPPGRAPDASRRRRRDRPRPAVHDVVYLGSDTRYIVDPRRRGQLVVTQQNLETSSMEALAQQGKAVRLIWKRQHELPIADGTS